MSVSDMQFKKLYMDDEAVSPVIGVILMVAITVILAAVIGTFVLGLGDQVQSQAPQVSWEFSTSNINDGTAENDILKVTHEGGDSATASNLDVTVQGVGTIYDDGSLNQDPSGDGTNDLASSSDTWPSTVSAGSTQSFEEGSGGVNVFSGDTTVRVVWQNPDSDKTSVIGSHNFNGD